MYDRCIVHDKSWSTILLEVKRSNVKVGVSLHSCECQSSSSCLRLAVSWHASLSEVLFKRIRSAINHMYNANSITFPQRGGCDVGPVTSDVREDGPTAHLHHNTKHFGYFGSESSVYHIKTVGLKARTVSGIAEQRCAV